jgi:hypothetical protein
MSVAKRILIAVILVFNLSGGNASSQSFSYRDSVYRRIIMEGGKSIDCHLSYLAGSSQVITSYKANAAELAELDKILRVTFSDTLVSIKSLSITGYGSIDGTYIRNEELSKGRAEGFAHYLALRYPQLSSYPITYSHVAEDWDGLRKMVSESSLAEKDRVLSLIDQVGIFDGREKLLMELNKGNTFRKMERDYFPLLRRVQLRIEYDLKKIIEEHYNVKIPQQDFAAILEQEKQRLEIVTIDSTKQSVANSDKTKRPKDPEVKSPSLILMPKKIFRPLLAVKTNLLYLGGYSAELEKEFFTPNIEVEYFVVPHWSISGEYVYQTEETQGDDAHVWAPSSLSFEPRYWFFDRSGHHHWLYVGIYGLGAQFDKFSSDAYNDGVTGSYYEGGLSVGCYIPLGSRIGLEFGTRLCYRYTDGDHYYYSNALYYYKSSYTENGLKATGFRASVSYRFGKKYSSSK